MNNPKNYESYNEENSENENTNNVNNFNSKSSSKVKQTRIKSLIYQQTKTNNNNSNKTNTNNMHVDFPADPSEPIYCICSEISYGQMICCDNDLCKIEWFHFECVKLSSKPKGKWYCPHCRGENHKVMKKFTNHNTATGAPAAANANYTYNNSSVRTK